MKWDFRCCVAPKRIHENCGGRGRASWKPVGRSFD